MPIHIAAAHAPLSAEHARLSLLVGVWDVELTLWDARDAAPAKARGFSVVEALLGGLFVQERLEGLVGEAPFVMMSWTGFDAKARCYQGSRIGSGDTTVFFETGVYDERAAALVLEGPASGARERRVVTLVSADAIRIECFDLDAGGASKKTAEMRYARRKE